MPVENQSDENTVCINGKSYATSKVFGKESGDKSSYFQSEFSIEGDVYFDDIKNLYGYELPQNVFISTNVTKSPYKNTQASFIDIARNNNVVFMSLEVSYHPSEWEENINVLSFIEIFRKQVLDTYGIQSTQEDIFEEDLICINFKVQKKASIKVKKVVNSFYKKLKV